MRSAFAETIADYVEWCRERGKEPERPYSGHFMLRLTPELHRRVFGGGAERKSLNGFIAEALEHWVLRGLR